MNISLRQLLNFTSGFEGDGCNFIKNMDFVECVKRMYKGGSVDSGGLAHTPGTVFEYSGKHMHVAGLMAAGALGHSDWHRVWDRFRQQTGLFPGSGSRYRNISERNPMIAGGLFTTAVEYAEFLRKHLREDLLSPGMNQQMYRDQIAGLGMGASPTIDQAGEEWHYGLGLWLECPHPAFQSSCANRRTFSSLGAYGFYPWIDWQNGYWGIVATDQYG